MRSVYIFFLAFVTAVSLPAVAEPFTPPIEPPTGSAGSVASLEEIELGGVGQWVLIRGYDISNPILLLLHGGPGASEMPFFRYYNSELEKHFIVVLWDRRGAGKSFSRSIPKETMTLGQNSRDTHQLVGILKKRFNKEKIFLVGHSWGSALGMMQIAQYPEDFYAFVGAGQVTDMVRNDQLAYDFALNEARNRGETVAILELERIGYPQLGFAGGARSLFVLRGWLTAFGGMQHAPEHYISDWEILRACTEYSLLDASRYADAADYVTEVMYDELKVFNLFDLVKKVEIPVYFLHGRYDERVPPELVLQYYEFLDAPAKEFIWFEKSAHLVPYEEPEKFNAFMIDTVKKEARKTPN